MKWLIYGHKGWIGSYVCDFIIKNYPDIELIFPRHRVDKPQEVLCDIDTAKPDRVLSFIGRTSGPGFNTIDYLQQKDTLVENLHDNLYAPLVLMQACESLGVHFTYLGTGCIFSYKDPHEVPFTPDSEPNFFGSNYSIVKGFTDRLSVMFGNTLNVRIRFPISEKQEPKNLLSKIIGYKRILNTLNSMTVLPDLIPILLEHVRKQSTGTLHLVNPEPTDHKSILDLYAKHVDPTHSYELMTEEQHDMMLFAKRSKNVLTSDCPQAPSTLQSIERIFLDKNFKQAEEKE